MMTGPGVIVLRRAFADTAPIDAATEVFRTIIAEQHATNTGGGDHFAKPGANDRIWNALEKLCLRAPDVFAAYYGNAMLALVSEAWLGPAYQVTSQINVVNPGGEAQSAHRDYHLGFMTPAQMALYPAPVHRRP
jgi:ectoine hydroxylase-related dioxygenase (phytanoyl-CoA dioxygenase family)